MKLTLTKVSAPNARRAASVAIVILALGCAGSNNPGPMDATPDAADVVASDAAMDASTDVAPADATNTDAGGDAVAADVPVSWPDSSVMTPPDWAMLRVGGAGSCSMFTPCGGNVVGTWDVSGGCFEIDAESAIAACPGAMVTRRTGRGRGRVGFGSDGFARRVADAEVDVAITVPAACAAFVSCMTLQNLLRPLATEATCAADASGGCNCTARLVTHIDNTDAYRIEANEIVSVSSGKRWAYCIAGNTLSYRDTSPTGAREPGTVELQRR